MCISYYVPFDIYINYLRCIFLRFRLKFVLCALANSSKLEEKEKMQYNQQNWWTKRRKHTKNVEHTNWSTKSNQPVATRTIIIIEPPTYIHNHTANPTCTTKRTTVVRQREIGSRNFLCEICSSSQYISTSQKSFCAKEKKIIKKA